MSLFSFLGTTAAYEIHEEDKTITVVSKRPKRSGEAVLWITLTVAFFWIARRQIHSPAFVIVTIFAIGSQVVNLFRGGEVKLTMTNFEFTCDGYFGNGYNPDRSISRADIIRFDYRDHEVGGPESSNQPSGLYASAEMEDELHPARSERSSNKRSHRAHLQAISRYSINE